MARRSLKVYGKLTRALDALPHHEGIINAIAPAEHNKGSAVICPPGSGKSTWISEIAPPWLLCNSPDHFILHLHANDDKADAYLKVIQQVFTGSDRHQEIFPDVQPDLERGWSARGLFFKWRDKTGTWPLVDSDGWAHMPAKDPQYISIGFTGGALGRRADTIILDDPFDPAEIDSPLFRQKFERRFKMVIKTRLRPGGRIIYVGNRWHHDDIVPKLAEMGYEVVTFPAISVDADGVQHSYWEEMFHLVYLQDIRKELGDIDFNCLYMGDPSGVEGALIKRAWFQYYRIEGQYIIIEENGHDGEAIPLSSLRIFQAVDPAASEKTSADYFAIVTVGADPKGRLFILDVIRQRLQGPDQPALMREAYIKWHPYAQGVEKVGYQLTLVQYAARTGLPVKELPRFGDKMSRHKTLAARYQAARIYHPIHAPWLGVFELELTQLPKAPHDDMADAACDAVEELAIGGGGMSAQELARLNPRRAREFLSTRW